MAEWGESGQTRRYCAQCGARVAPGGAFCPSCGAPLGGAGGGGGSVQGPPAGADRRSVGEDAPDPRKGRPALLAAGGVLLLLVAAWLVGVLPSSVALLTGLAVVAGAAARRVGAGRAGGAPWFVPVALLGGVLVAGVVVAAGAAYLREPEYDVLYRRDISELLQLASGNDYGDTGVLDEEGTALYLQVRVREADDVPAVKDQIASDFPAYDCVAIDYYGRGDSRPIEVSYLGDQACSDDIETIEDFAGPLGRI